MISLIETLSYRCLRYIKQFSLLKIIGRLLSIAPDTALA